MRKRLLAPLSPAVILDRLTRREMTAFLRADIPHSGRTHTPSACPGRWPRNAYVAMRADSLARALEAVGWITVHLDRRDPHVWIARKEKERR
jgi:hypothetical protein